MSYPIITIAGGSCSGKTTFVAGFQNSVVVSMDSFYKDISDLVPDTNGKYDFDTPEAFAMDECRQAIETLSNGQDVEIPLYDYISCKRTGKELIKAPTQKGQVVVLEGIFALCGELKDLGDIRIYIEAPVEIRIARRIKRDVSRGREVKEIIEQFVLVEEGHQKYIEPSKVHANLVIPFSHSPLVFST